MREYDEIFEWYVGERNPDAGIADVAAFCNTLAPGARLLDLGCGDGVPITRLLVERGFEVYGVDSSLKMIAGFRANFPKARAECATIRDADFFGTTFAAVVAWGVLFHLTAEDQAYAMAKIAGRLEPKGKLLFTSGDEQGTRTGSMNGVTLSYTSLGRELYAKILQENGLRLLHNHCDKWKNWYYIAEKETP